MFVVYTGRMEIRPVYVLYGEKGRACFGELGDWGRKFTQVGKGFDTIIL